MLYKEKKTKEISFPLGGIGSGSIGLAGNGRLIDWEIFNKPSKGTLNGFSHFAVSAACSGKVIDSRILQGDLLPPYTGETGQKKFSGFGFGPRTENLCGMPHFRRHSFKGEFPFAEISYEDDNFPGKPLLRAWSPFIPGNDKDSSAPVAMFEIEMKNTADKALDYTFITALSNPFDGKNTVDRVSTKNGLTRLTMYNGDKSSDISITSAWGDVSFQEYWCRGAWCDALEVYWRELTAGGRFRNRRYTEAEQNYGKKFDTGHMAFHLSLEKGQTGKVCFAVTWSIPDRSDYWGANSAKRAEEEGISATWRNWYATQWKNSLDSGEYVIGKYDELYDRTARFRDALFNSTLPEAVLDAVSSTMSVLRTPTCLRLEDGTFYGWEGVGIDSGSCPGTCTHVWNYCQALPFLFPGLERSIRESNYKYNIDIHGGAHFRMLLPLGLKAGIEDGRPCVDGQFGDVLKTYREWKICGDTDWLRGLWPTVKKTVRYAWSQDNYDRWDPEKDGVIKGRQHHTLDMELFGANSWLNGFYLAALKAASEMALALEDDVFAAECTEIYKKGKKWTDENLFNGEYYCQKFDIKNRGCIAEFTRPDGTDRAEDAYWSDEFSEVKYQIGEGCEIDAVIAQWHAGLYGLGEIFEPAKCRKTLESIFRYNFKESMRDEYNPWRNFCLNDESGTVICAWPEGRLKPMIPLPYSQETMHGFEYAFACNALQNGMVEEGIRIVESIRSRYDGEKRNPWNEIECGSNYARSMAAYSLLNVFSGFEFDMTRGMIGFAPLREQQYEDFLCFWSLGVAWGNIAFTESAAEISILSGEISIKTVRLPFVPVSVSASALKLDFDVKDREIILKEPVILKKGDSLTLNKFSHEAGSPLI